jgi:hypothetical protein
MLYTIVPPEMIMDAGGTPAATSFVLLEDGTVAEVHGFGTARPRLVRLSSTNPFSYLLESNAPGSTWPASRPGTPMV